MSVYRPRGKDGSYKSPYYHFDFVLKVNGERRRFHGSTEATTKKAAQEVERRERDRLKQEKPNDHMTLAAACHRYYDEVAASQPSADDTAKALEHCARLIGGARKLVNVTADDIALAVRRRSAETYGKKVAKVVSGATVNRQIVEPLQRLMRRAKRVWGVSCDPDTIPWGSLKMRESQERVREFSVDEADAFWAVLRQDYLAFTWFLAHRGFRVRSVTGMQKKHVDLANRRVNIWIKGEGWTWKPITAEQAAVLQTEMARSPLPAVWTYEVQKGAKKGMRRPVTYSGFRGVMRNTLRDAAIEDFRIHDLRHDFASKLLRATSDLALVQKTLAHRDIKSTVRYAHVLDEDVSAGMEKMGGRTGIALASRIRPGKAADEA